MSAPVMKLVVVVLVLGVVVWLTRDVPPLGRAGILLALGSLLASLAALVAKLG